MRFLFLAVKCTPFHAKSLEERPLGGTVTGIIRLSECLQAHGHDVTVATLFENPPPSLPKYIHISQIEFSRPYDVFICIREWRHLFNPSLTTEKRFYWTGDSHDFLSTMGIGDPRYYTMTDGLFLVSRWQAEALCQASGYPIYKTWILKNGVYLPFFEGTEQRQRKRMIYSSLPHRGLVYLPRIFKALKAKHPELELDIFGSFDRNDPKWSPGMRKDPIGGKILDELQAMGCKVYGSVSQRQLAREFMKSSILAYPSNFEETSCITAMEALAAGCVIVTTDIGALKETIGDAGILIKEKPGSEAYYEKYIAAADRVLSDDAYFNMLSQRALERGKSFSWENTAQSLLDYLRVFHQLI